MLGAMEDENDAIIEVPRRTKFGVAVVVVLLHVALFLALLRAFAPDFTARAMETVVATFSVTVTTPPPKEIDKAGAAGDPGKKAVARAVNAQKPKIPIAKNPAPRAASTGNANSSGAHDTGAGTGANGPGNGPGAGSGGDGSGGGQVQQAVKIAGDINSARDYPIATRDLRIDDYVIVVITVGASGNPTACRVHRPSRDGEANAITCQLALKRFRFRPATDAQGNPVASTYGWKQSWHY